MTDANKHFGSSNGTETYYHYSLTKYHFTDGVRELAEGCGAFWLIDLIMSHQVEKKVSRERFQVWDLRREFKDAFTILCTDGNKNKITSQVIQFSDFPYDSATLWFVDGTLLLPCEY